MNLIKIKPGQVWKDLDPRRNRYLSVILVDKTHAYCGNERNGNVTCISKQRFQPGQGRFALVEPGRGQTYSRSHITLGAVVTGTRMGRKQ